MSTSSVDRSWERTRQTWFVVGLLALFVGLSVQYSHKALANRSAILRWQPQLLGLEDGVDIAQRYNYPNPPVMAILLYPLAKLPPLATALVWYYAKVALTLLVLRWVFQLVEETGRPFPVWAKGLTVLLSLWPIVGDLRHGNVNLFILFLVVAALTAYRCRRDFLAGVILALAVSCKVTPALFIPYLVWKRAWRALAGCMVGLLLFLWPGVVPGLVLGFEENRQQLHSWYNEMVYPFVVEGKVTSEHNNQSLPGFVARLATHSPSFSTYIENQYTPLAYHNVWDLSTAQAKWVVKGCMGLFALLAVWVCRTPASVRQGWRLSAEFSLVALGMLIFSERTWKQHCVPFVLPFAVLCYYLAACSPGRWMRTYLIGSLVVVLLLMASTSTGLFDNAGCPGVAKVANEVAKMAQVYGAYVAAYFVLVAALITILRIPGASSPGFPVSFGQVSQEHGTETLNIPLGNQGSVVAGRPPTNSFVNRTGVAP
jgi:hypothetical protein